jgi:hypothetical protein
MAPVTVLGVTAAALTASRTAASICWACRRKRMPAAVSFTPAACRENSGAPTTSSNPLSEAVMDDCETLQRCAALDTWPVSAIATKCCICFKVGSIDFSDIAMSEL